MATTTIHNFASDGSSIARGTASVADGETISTGLSQVGGILVFSDASDVVVTTPSVSGGNVTANVYAAGVPSEGAHTVYWEAWTSQRV